MTRQGTMARSWSRAALLAAAALTCWSCWCFESARADVYVLVSAYDLEPLPDLEADFGPSVPSMGIEGVLRLADPHDACQPFTFTDFDTPWIALISRQQQVQSMNCTFDIKVMHAQMAGAAAAIVYDYFYESLITMSMPKGHTEPSIPSVFVTDRSGFILTKLLEVEGQDLRVRIMPVTTVAWLEALVSTLLGLMSITMVIASFYAMRSWGLWLSGNQNLAGGAAAAGPGLPPGRNAGLPPSAIRALPVIIYEAPSSRSASRTCSWKPSDKAKGAGEGGPSATSALEEGLLPSPNQSSNSSEHDWPHQTGRHAGETKRVCAICLEDYTSGEKVRVLPCLHRFHKTCVDQWFGSRRMCPVCKHDAGTPLAPPPSDGDHAGRLGFTARLARLGAGLLSFMGLGPPASADPAAEVLLSRSNPTSPNHEPASQPATNRRHSRLWDLYLAYAALDAEASQEGGVAGSAAAGAAGEGAEEDVEAGLADEGPVAYEPPPLLPEETAAPALRSVREGPSHPIPIQPAAEAGRGEGAVGPAAEDGAAAVVQVPESLPFPATPPMQAPGNHPTRVD